MLASANVAAEGVSKMARLVDAATSFLHLLVLVGQAAVAGVTVYYIWRKAKAVRFPKGKKTDNDEGV